MKLVTSLKPRKICKPVYEVYLSEYEEFFVMDHLTRTHHIQYQSHQYKDVMCMSYVYIMHMDEFDELHLYTERQTFRIGRYDD